MSNRAPNPVIDGKQIQAVVNTDEQGYYQTAAIGTAASMAPTVMGTVNPSGNVQYMASDALNNVLVSLGTGLDPFDDNVALTTSVIYPSQVMTAFAGGETVLNQTLLSFALGGPAIGDIRGIFLDVENKSAQTINACVVNLTDTIGTTVRTLPYVVPSVSILTNTTGRLVVPFLSTGPSKTISASLGLAGGATASTTVKTQLGVLGQENLDIPSNYLVYGNLQSKGDSSYNSLVGAPGASQHLYLIEAMISNTNGSINTIVTLNAGSGGAIITGVGAAAPGGGKIGPLGIGGRGLMVGAPGSPNLALFAQSTSTSSPNVSIFAICRVGP